MILTNCPVCAAPLPPTSAKQCSRCKTRYCGPECQKTHWEEGGHDKLCRKIRKGGGAEQYHADTRYTEAVGVAAEACAEDTKGQTCYICTEVVHRRTGEGLVRGCACHTTEGYVHVSCLAEQAKILVAEAEENNLDGKAFDQRFLRWYHCSLCKQDYHGVVRSALGWGCWKTYVGRPETDQVRQLAMDVLGSGLFEADRSEEALSVEEANLAMKRRVGASEGNILVVQCNLAGTYQMLGRLEQAASMYRDVYSGSVRIHGKEHEGTVREANNYSNSLLHLKRFKEAEALLRKTMPVARRVLGESQELTLRMRFNYAMALYLDPSATLDNLREAVTTLEDTARTARRVFGGAHPLTMQIEECLRYARAALDARESSA